jgi:hypothetical protein
MAGYDQKVLDWLERDKFIETERENWKNSWQLISDYIFTRRGDFIEHEEQGTFLNREVFDTTGPMANRDAASAFVGHVFPSTYDSFNLVLVDNLKDDRSAKIWLEKCEEILIDAMNDERCKLSLAIDETMQDLMAFCTAGVFVTRGEDSLLEFRPWSVKEMGIIEDYKEEVNIVHRRFTLTVRNVVDKWGIENMSDKVQQLYKEGKYNEKVNLLHIIEPREDRDPMKRNNMNMPYRSVFVDKDNKHIISEGGFKEMPVKVVRFSKKIGETYGRGPGFNALPDVLQVNAMMESIMLASEITLDPPLGVMDGALSSEKLEVGPSSVTVFNPTALGGAEPLFPLYTVGDFNPSYELITELRQRITKHYFLDRLLDFNNQTEMTATETVTRLDIRNSSLRGPVERMTSELFSPLIQRSFNILLDMGMFGAVEEGMTDLEEVLIGMGLGVSPITEVPDSVRGMLRDGKPIFKVKYKTPAARDDAERELSNINRFYQIVGASAQYNPNVLQLVDWDNIIRSAAHKLGIPEEFLTEEDEVEKMRQTQGKMLEEQQQAEMMAAQAKQQQ